MQKSFTDCEKINLILYNQATATHIYFHHFAMFKHKIDSIENEALYKAFIKAAPKTWYFQRHIPWATG